MKKISSKKIKTLIRYFKDTEKLNRNPRVLALLITEEERDFFVKMVNKIENQIDDVPTIPGIMSHVSNSKDLFPTAGISFELFQRINNKYGLYTLALKYFYEKYGKFSKKPLSTYNYAILIREEKTKKMYKGLDIPDNFDRTKFTQSLILIHEFTHVVEQEIYKCILPEDSGECLKYEMNVIRNLPKIFWGLKKQAKAEE